MDRLSAFELEVLENLPVEPTGLSLPELADGLLDSRAPQAKGRIRLALDRIDKILGGLYVYRGNDDFGGAKVKMYGIPRAIMPRVRAFFARREAVCV